MEDIFSMTPEELSEYLKDAQGRFRTQSLFWESRNPSFPAVFTTKDRDHQGALSLHRLYMEISDPTEYLFAIKCFGSWKHWQALSSTNWFKPTVLEWRAELDAKLRAEAVKEMKRIASEGESDSARASASRWLASKGYKGGGSPTRGRPSKEETEGRLKQELRHLKLVDDDFDRIKGMN